MDSKLIFDIGLHRGEDTQYYLARGFSVVAIEADPDLAQYCREKFKTEIERKALTIIHGAIVEDDTQKSIRFYKNKSKTVWGTVVKDFADRNAMLGAGSVEIEVPVVNLEDVIAEFGCPYYVKIDIEGMDLVCVRKLQSAQCRPKYISIESNKTNFDELIAELDTFRDLGYKKFFLQQQADIHERKVPRNSTEGPYVDYMFPRGSTGPFGTDLGKGWVTYDQAVSTYRKIFRDYRWFGDDALLRKHVVGRYAIHLLSRILRRKLPGWYDTHVMLE